MRDNLMTLTSEERNPASMNLPHMSVAESTALMNQEDGSLRKSGQRGSAGSQRNN